MTAELDDNRRPRQITYGAFQDDRSLGAATLVESMLDYSDAA